VAFEAVLAFVLGVIGNARGVDVGSFGVLGPFGVIRFGFGFGLFAVSCKLLFKRIEQFLIALFGTFFGQVAGYLGSAGDRSAFLDVIFGGGGVDQSGAGCVWLGLIGEVFNARWNFTRGVVAAQEVVDAAENRSDQSEDAGDGGARVALRLLLFAQLLIQFLRVL